MPPRCSGTKESEYVIMDLESRSQRERHGAKFFVLRILLGHSDWNPWSGLIGDYAACSMPELPDAHHTNAAHPRMRQLTNPA